jgi:hypothetical protein
MPQHTVTDNASGAKYIVDCEAAPGADLLDPNCRHGDSFHVKNMTPFQKEWHPHMMEFIPQAHAPAGGDLSRFTFVFWAAHPERLAILQRDKDYGIPGMFWAMAVGSSCSEQGGGEYSRICVMGYLVTKSIIDNPGLSPNAMLEKLEPVLNIIQTDSGLFQFMHRSDFRKCMCMQYVAAAVAADGAQPDVGMDVLNTCGWCEEVVDGSKRCGRCKIMHYCNAECQKKAWKQHKKVCYPEAGSS